MLLYCFVCWAFVFGGIVGDEDFDWAEKLLFIFFAPLWVPFVLGWEFNKRKKK
jgi:hypothetical protein